MEYNLRGTESADGRRSCLNCKHFVSWADFYEDTEEEDDCGICDLLPNEYHIGDMRICNGYKNIYSA